MRSEANSQAAAALPANIFPPDFFAPPHLDRFVRAIIDRHWQRYTDSSDSPHPKWRGVFRREPDWSLVGRFDAAHLDEEQKAVVDGWFTQIRERFRTSAWDIIKGPVDASDGAVGADGSDEEDRELSGDGS